MKMTGRRNSELQAKRPSVMVNCGAEAVDMSRLVLLLDK
jgi:hypothetical protein